MDLFFRIIFFSVGTIEKFTGECEYTNNMNYMEYRSHAEAVECLLTYSCPPDTFVWMDFVTFDLAAQNLTHKCDDDWLTISDKFHTHKSITYHIVEKEFELPEHIFCGENIPDFNRTHSNSIQVEFFRNPESGGSFLSRLWCTGT